VNVSALLPQLFVMATIKHTKTFQKPTCNSGDTFTGCNLTQAQMDTPICVGKTGLTFIRCNLINCIVPADSVVQDCNTAKKDFCTNEMPHLKGKLKSDCPENCKHRNSAEKQWVDIDKQELKAHVDANTEVTNSAPATRVVDEKDAYGLIRQQLQKQVYTYTSTVEGRR